MVQAFRAAVDVEAGLVLPWDRAARPADVDLDAAETTSGTIWSRTATCSWRVEGERAVVTVLSDTMLELEGHELERVACEVRDGPRVAWLQAPFSRGPDTARMLPRRYVVDGIVAHERLVFEEDHHATR